MKDFKGKGNYSVNELENICINQKELLDKKQLTNRHILIALKSCLCSMQAHPDNVEDSEFEAIVNKGWEVINKALGQ